MKHLREILKKKVVMKMLKIINGDLLKAKEKFIVHQCNAQGVMGSGVAKQIATLYPEAEKQYKEFINKIVNLVENL